MPSVDENLRVWNTEYQWSDAGEEWSAGWGGSRALWFGALLPRIHSFLPTGTILEIAPGFGRWTEYLKDQCDRLVLVDLSERCIAHCQERFAGARNIEYHINDGWSLDMVDDHSIDFVFSFDSLVHAEADVLECYLAQLARKLKPDGAGFIHHSNAHSYWYLLALARVIPGRWRSRLVARGVLVNDRAWRAESESAERFARQCNESGLACVSQEKISWGLGYLLIDALSVFTPRGSRWERPPQVVRNPLFSQEARRFGSLYADPAARVV